MKRVISISNQKGGVGKTTTAVNLGASLASKGKRVLVIDLDPQANASSGFGVYRENISEGIYQVIIGQTPIQQVIQQTGVPGLFLAPATSDLTGAEIELVNTMARELRLRSAIEPVRDQFDFVFIDCPPSLGLLTVNSLTAADAVLIPLQCEYYALEGLGQLIHTIELVKSSLNPGLEVLGIVLTMFDGRNSLAHQVEDEVREHFCHKVFKTVIPRNVRLSEAPSHGLPALLYDVASRGCQGYLAMAEELLTESTAPIASAA
ncbi:MAG: ParA family protein [Deltaproteobacteria bacterium]|nr:ParA family protein [Deltaproteobacteria bacterium]